MACEEQGVKTPGLLATQNEEEKAWKEKEGDGGSLILVLSESAILLLLS